MFHDDLCLGLLLINSEFFFHLSAADRRVKKLAVGSEFANSKTILFLYRITILLSKIICLCKIGKEIFKYILQNNLSTAKYL
jgi:hypothetical protein